MRRFTLPMRPRRKGAMRRASWDRSWRAGTAWPPKRVLPCDAVALDELANLVDDGEGVEVALALGVAPGEEAVAAQDDAVAAGVFLDGLAHHQAEFEAGALPGEPDQGVAELAVELLHFGLAVGGGGKGDTPVGVEVIDVGEGRKPCSGVSMEAATGLLRKVQRAIHGDHVVFSCRRLCSCVRGPVGFAGRGWRNRRA